MQSLRLYKSKQRKSRSPRGKWPSTRTCTVHERVQLPGTYNKNQRAHHSRAAVPREVMLRMQDKYAASICKTGSPRSSRCYTHPLGPPQPTLGSEEETPLTRGWLLIVRKPRRLRATSWSLMCPVSSCRLSISLHGSTSTPVPVGREIPALNKATRHTRRR